jgi:putative DNA methylase
MQLTYPHLPHRYAIGEPLFITFRLQGSLPPGREFPERHISDGRAFVRMDRLLDEQRAGAAYLRMPAVAEVVVSAIRKGSPHDYDLHAWVVMPNHVHLLITPKIDVPLLLRKVKGASAREANQLLGLTGRPFWQAESFDRLVRSVEEFHRIENYIIQNPVRAGLAPWAEEYCWSSVSRVGGLKPTAG